jgi:hypothetical protein
MIFPVNLPSVSFKLIFKNYHTISNITKEDYVR